MIGKIIADASGLTDKLDGTRNNKKFDKQYEIDSVVNKKEWEEFQAEVKAADGDEVKIKAIIDDSQLDALKNNSAIYDYAVEQSKAGKDVDLGSVNMRIVEQNNKAIAEQAHGILGVNNALKEYKKLGDNISAKNKLADTISQSNAGLGKYLKNLNGANAGLGKYAMSLAGATAKTIALEVATTALNAALSMGVSLIIQGVISGITYLIQYEEKQKEAIENAQELAQKYAEEMQSIRDETKKTTESAKEIANEYAKLRQGVNASTNENISLSNNSYERFLELNNQLAELFPTLTKSYDQNGNAILDLSGDVDTVTGAIARLVEQQTKLAKQDIKKNLSKYVDGDEDNDGQLAVIEGYRNQLDEAEELRKRYEKFYTIFKGGKVSSQDIGIGDIDKIFKNAGVEGGANRANLVDGYWDFSDLSEDEFNKVKTAFENLYSDMVLDVKNAESELKQANQELSSQLMVWVEDLPTYEDNPETQQFLTNLINGIQWDEIGGGNLDIDKIKQYITSNILAPIQSVIDNPKEKASLENAFQQLFSLDFSKLSSKDAESKIQNYLSIILGIWNKHLDKNEQKNMTDIVSLMGFEDYFDSNKKMQQSLHSIAGSSTVDMSKLSEYTKDFTKDQIDAWLEATQGAENAVKAIELYEESLSHSVNSLVSFKQAWKSLGSDDKEEFLELAEAGKLTTETFEELEGAQTLLENTGLGVESLTKKINNLVSSASQLASMKDGISAISDILGQKKDGEVIGADVLDSLPDELKECTKEYNQFVNVLGNSKSSMSQCQKASNKLATAFVNSNNFLSKLNESTKDSYVSMLKEMGVKNANEVVTDALAKKNVALALSEDIVAENKKKLTEMTWEEVSSTTAYVGATEVAKEAMKQLYLQETIFANNDLNTDEKISKLKDYAKEIGNVILLQKAENAAMAAASNASDTIQAHKAYNEAFMKVMNEGLQVKQTKVVIEVDTPSTDSNSSSSSSEKDTKQKIDWLARLLTVLQNKIDLTKTKFENLFDIGKKESNLDKQIAHTNTLLEAQTRVANKYNKLANNVKLSDNLKKKVREGDYSIGNYSSKTADKINQYQDYIDKAKEATKAAQELETEIRNLKEQKLQLRVDKADNRLSKLNSEYENATTAKDKNSNLKKQRQWIKQSYEYQIKIAKLTEDEVKQAELEAKLKKELRDNSISQLQNTQDKIDANIALNQSQIDNAKTAKEKEQILKEQIENTKASYKNQIKIAKEEGNSLLVAKLREEKKKALLDLEVQSLQYYADEETANSNLAKQNAEISTSVKERNEFERESINAVKKQYDYLIAIAKLKGDMVEVSRLEAELTGLVADSYKTQFDNIQEGYDHRLSELESNIKRLNTAISIVESHGGKVNSSFYDDLITKETKNNATLIAQRDEMQKKLNDALAGGLEVGMPEFYEMVEALRSITDAADESTLALEELFQKKIDADTEARQSARSIINDLNEEADFYKQIASYQDLIDDGGNLTTEGKITVAMSADKMTNSKVLVDEVEKDIKRQGELFNAGKIGYDKYIETIRELKQERNDYIQTYYDEAEAIKDVVQNALESQGSYLDELIQKYKDLLSQQKNEHDYQKNLEKQVKNLSLLEKQAETLKLDDSEEGRARYQKVQLQLQEAREALEESEYDKYISDQEELLDSLSEEYQDFIGNQLDNMTVLVEELIANLDKDAKEVNESLNKFASSWGFELSNAMDNATESGSYSSITSSIQSNAEMIANAIHDEYLAERSESEKYADVLDKNTMDESAYTPSDSGNKTDDSSKDKLVISDELLDKIHSNRENSVKNDTSNDKSNDISVSIGVPDTLVDTLKYDKDDIKAFLDKYAKSPSEGSSYQTPIGNSPFVRYIYQKTKKSLKAKDEKKLAKKLGVDVSDKTSEGIMAWRKEALKKLKAVGFSNGGIASELNEVALQNGDDGWVTLKKGEGILKPLESQALLDIAPYLPKISEVVGNLTNHNMHEVVNKGNTVQTGDLVVNMSLPNVTDAKEFESALIHAVQTRPKVVNLLQDVTINQALGSNKSYMRY